jgi:leucyl-tRNA synthetase
MKAYDPKKIERKWQERWEDGKLHKASSDFSKKKYYPLVEFPYPSGDGLHVGHPRPYIALDIVARKRRAEGYNVLYPFGWDAFGLPTENYAIKTGIHPKEVTRKNTDRFRKQVQSLGLSFDWSREINTTDPKYYKWTQWIFLQLFKRGLAYKKKMPINWCLDCKVGLANEEVVGGLCERCGGKTERREKEQWMLKITEYADRLDKDLDTVDYEERIKVQQRNWIGRSEGTILNFKIVPSARNNTEQAQKFRDKGLRESASSPRDSATLTTVSVFTTRPDTLFGATYLVISPEKVLEILRGNNELRVKNYEEVLTYIERAKKKTEIERVAEGREKTGVELKGVGAINPATKSEIPIYVADYVLATYGTGAIMAVPAHDERDFAFANNFNLTIKQVIAPAFYNNREIKSLNYLPYIGDGIL